MSHNRPAGGGAMPVVLALIVVVAVINLPDLKRYQRFRSI